MTSPTIPDLPPLPEPFADRHLIQADVSAQPQWAFSRKRVLQIVAARDAQWAAVSRRTTESR
jgi:hypothetical protein